MDLYLIAHRVRGEPAFDIACQMICPECDNDPGCSECDGLGYWWIVPTSGHRAYPYHNWKLDEVLVECAGEYESINYGLDEMPPSLPDHYPTRAAPTISLIDTLGLRKPKVQVPSVPIARRF